MHELHHLLKIQPADAQLKSEDLSENSQNADDQGLHKNPSEQPHLLKPDAKLRLRGIAAGIRRIEALVGAAAIEYQQSLSQAVAQACNILKTDNFSVVDRAKYMIEHTSSIEHENMLLKEKLVHLECVNFAHEATECKGVKVVARKVDGYSMRELRLAVDELKNTLKTCVVVLGSVDEKTDKVNLIAAVSKDMTAKVKAGDLVNAVAAHVDGKGGGRPDMAQAGGTNKAGLDAAIAAVAPFLEQNL